MPRTIRFHLDEHVPHAVADGLRRLGIDVTSSTDASLLGATDADHIAYGLSQTRVIVTEDDGFLALAAEGAEHAGLTDCKQNTRSIGQVLRVEIAVTVPVAFLVARVVVDSVFVFPNLEDLHQVDRIEDAIEIHIARQTSGGEWLALALPVPALREILLDR
jgi:predicted nuclease of predicted toxin-antitoxin system